MTDLREAWHLDMSCARADYVLGLSEPAHSFSRLRARDLFYFIFKNGVPYIFSSYTVFFVIVIFIFL